MFNLFPFISYESDFYINIKPSKYYFRFSGIILSKNKKKKIHKLNYFINNLLSLNIYKNFYKTLRLKKKIIISNVKLNSSFFFVKFNLINSSYLSSHLFYFLDEFFKNKNTYISFFPTKKITFLKKKKKKLKDIQYYILKNTKSEILKLFKNMYLQKKNPRKGLLKIFKKEIFNKKNSQLESALQIFTMKYFLKK